MRRTTKSKPQSCRRRRNPTEENPSTHVDLPDEINPHGSRRFFGCYLLTSLSPRYKGHSYIGFTVDPKRRIRQHNGEITSGAFRTKKKRPWEMVFCIHGFPTQVAALQFEWAWQHPRESLAVREAASAFKTLGGLANKIKLALTMITLSSWNSMDLTVSFFSTKYMTHAAGSPSLPPQMKVWFCPMDELPCYTDACHDEDDIDSSHTQEDDDMSHEGHVSSIDDAIVSPTVEEDEQLFPLLPTDTRPLSEEEMEPYCQSPADILQSDRFTLLEDLTVPSDQAGPSMADASSKDTDAFAEEDDTTCILIDESREEQRHSAYEQLPGRVGDNVLPSPAEGIEIIDLFTPSPECRNVSGSKKRRVARRHPDFIDLTRSPVFVEL